MALLDAARRFFARGAAPEAAPVDRRDFFRTAAGLGAGMAAGSLLLPDEAWAGVEERAARFGITPGTLVDAQGRALGRAPMGTDAFIAEIMIFGGNFAVRGYALCDGQLLSIAQNTALFALLGTTFGGNGQTTFGLPDLRGRFPMHFGQGPGLSPRSLGEAGGVETVPLLSSQMPAHTHNSLASSAPGTTDAPSGAYPARPASSIPTYGTTPDVAMGAGGVAGGGQPHENMPPYLVLNFQIALQGIFPPRD